MMRMTTAVGKRREVEGPLALKKIPNFLPSLQLFSPPDRCLLVFCNLFKTPTLMRVQSDQVRLATYANARSRF